MKRNLSPFHYFSKKNFFFVIFFFFFRKTFFFSFFFIYILHFLLLYIFYFWIGLVQRSLPAPTELVFGPERRNRCSSRDLLWLPIIFFYQSCTLYWYMCIIYSKLRYIFFWFYFISQNFTHNMHAFFILLYIFLFYTYITQKVVFMVVCIYTMVYIFSYI